MSVTCERWSLILEVSNIGRWRKYYFGVLDKWSLIGGVCWSLSRVGQTWKICFINNGGLPRLVAVVSGVTFTGLA